MPAGTNNKPILYFIPGLAADERLFYRYRLKEDYECHFLNWVDPLPGENLAAYAQRYSQQIDTTRPFVLIGCSLGGIMSVEMSHYIQPEKIILISSLERAKEFPPYLRFFKYFQVYWLIPFWIFERSVAMYRQLMGRSNAKEAAMLHDMVKNTSPKFFKWAIHEVLHWKDRTTKAKVYGIHGDRDILFPHRYVGERAYIPKGDHFMVVLFTQPIEKEIRKILEVD